jgi:pyruvate-formate lyase-activating enzyme
MQIVSIIPEAFCEWETEVSLGLCCLSCNLKCWFCHLKDKIYDPRNTIGTAKELFFKHLNPMHTALVVSGGEPTLWEASLFELLLIAKHAGLKTKVFSNAMNFGAIFTLNKYKLVDMYSFDVKAAKDISSVVGIDISDEQYFKNLYTTIKNCKETNTIFELRHTMAPGIDVEAVKQLLFGADMQGIQVHYQKYIEYQQ